MTANQFKEKYSFEKRQNESKKVIQKYPDRVPIIVQKHLSSDLPDVNKCKYLVPKDMTMSQFIFVIRKRLQLEPSQSLFVMVNHGLVRSNDQLGDIYVNKSIH